jgi:prepilin peptidase CpaA
MLAVAVITDVRVGKVYNKLTVPCAAAGLTLAGLGGGRAGLGDHALAAGAALAVGLVLSGRGKVGGGDATLLIAVGALKGFPFVVWAMLLTGVAGGALAGALLIRRRALRQTAANMVANMLSTAAGVPTDLAAGSALGKIPYSVAIALGSVAALALGM